MPLMKLLPVAILATLASAEIKYYTLAGAKVANFIETKTEYYIEYVSNSYYLKLYAMDAKLLGGKTLTAKANEVIEIL